MKWLKNIFHDVHGIIRRVLSRGTSMAIMAVATVGIICTPTIGTSIMISTLTKTAMLLTLSFTIDLLRSDRLTGALYNLNGLLSTASIGIAIYYIANGGVSGLNGIWIIIAILLVSSFISGYILEEIELAPASTHS